MTAAEVCGAEEAGRVCAREPGHAGRHGAADFARSGGFYTWEALEPEEVERLRPHVTGEPARWLPTTPATRLEIRWRRRPIEVLAVVAAGLSVARAAIASVRRLLGRR